MVENSKKHTSRIVLVAPGSSVRGHVFAEEQVLNEIDRLCIKLSRWLGCEFLDASDGGFADGSRWNAVLVAFGNTVCGNLKARAMMPVISSALVFH